MTVNISDLGEAIPLKGISAQPQYGRHMQSSTSGDSSHGQDSLASDVHAFGYILAKMVKMFWDLQSRHNGNVNYSMPECVLEWIRLCAEPEIQRIDLVADKIEDAWLDGIQNIKFFESQMITVDPDSLIEDGSRPVTSITRLSNTDVK